VLFCSWKSRYTIGVLQAPCVRVMRKQRATRDPSQETESTTQNAAGRSIPPDVPPTPATEPRTPSEPHTPSDGRDQAARTGVDARQRGWYWHWNGIVTQYAPLIGLKGVGLLNSYTVWTDRREQSPTRGYAFPSQQSEADFYGEDRAELITINKILVALDLIEIRKEMVQRTDPQGRKWKVPHNLYRVKDRPDGLELRTEDVLRVAELASRDAAVFRHVKRIFSERFTPIDRDNIWHHILAEVANHPVWQELTDKTAKIEARASARSRAGHKARGKQAADTPVSPTLMTTGHSDAELLGNDERLVEGPQNEKTSDAQTNNGLGSHSSAVASGNSGSGIDVDPVNTGSQGGDTSSAETTNNGQESVVAPSNATYYQEISTTTTTSSSGNDTNTERGLSDAHGTDHLHEESVTVSESAGQDESPPAQNAGVDGLDDNTTPVQTSDNPGIESASRQPAQRSLADPAAGGPLVDPSPLVVSLFEAANNRACSPLERILLGEIERDAGDAAARCGETGADWVAAAVREAVSSGSAFVAPKRISEIVKRWSSSGARPQFNPPPSQAVEDGDGERPDLQPPVRLPRGRSAKRVWDEVLADMSRVLDDETHVRLFSGSRICGYRDGAIDIEVAPEAVSKLSAEYCPLLQRHLERHIGGAVAVNVRPASARDESQVPVSVANPVDPIVISQSDAEQGKQLWRAVLNEIRPSMDSDDLARLRGALPLGQDLDGHIVIGAPTSLAARLIEGRCRRVIETALLAVLGEPVTVRVAANDSWIVDNERSGQSL
jgi:hypothetical protein